MTDQSKRALSQQQTHDALAKAGAELIAKNGFAGASVRDIAKRAGYTQGAFYSNFKSKEDLVFAVLRSQFQYAYVTIEEFSKDTTKPVTQMVMQAAQWLDEICGSNENTQLETEISLHALRDPVFAKTYYALLDDHAAKMAQIVQAATDARQLRLRAPVSLVAMGMISMARGLKLMAPHYDPQFVRQTLAVFLESVIQPASDDAGHKAE
ncbi:transcriptional regulator, TetR family [Yoonia tamlensis]|uniref:Transcriptional regulator, TetR family n=1 Tax=Yoonia tamlensis TaxID=390270 RepID=A0A1I6HFC6_9RHOB|nr:TetR/AcrR family transcriptional regulator [Yoonia tamlensis]SFR53081.1 transcriptional regulator, TetR family [Yoonia tamlensis]